MSEVIGPRSVAEMIASEKALWIGKPGWSALTILRTDPLTT